MAGFVARFFLRFAIREIEGKALRAGVRSQRSGARGEEAGMQNSECGKRGAGVGSGDRTGAQVGLNLSAVPTHNSIYSHELMYFTPEKLSELERRLPGLTRRRLRSPDS